MAGVPERLAEVRRRIAEAAARAGREPGELTTIVVTKFHPASLIETLAACGVKDVGESRHQEASAKAEELRSLELTWHFVGQLQSKKARAVRRYADVIHSVDRESVLTALDEPGAPAVGVFLQVDLGQEPGSGRAGVAPERLDLLAERALAIEGLSVLGVMGVAPLGTNPRRAFTTLREASERLRRLAPDARFISAGMSGDFPEAIAEGATHLRIGTAITGNRPQHG